MNKSFRWDKVNANDDVCVALMGYHDMSESAPLDKMKNARSVAFPLRGEWCATETPAHRIPSHGNALLGQTYAYDFARLGKSEYDFCSFPLAAYIVFGVPTRSSYSYGEAVHSATDGTVVAVSDVVANPFWLHPLVDMVISKWLLLRKLKRGKDVQLEELFGNYVFVRVDNELFAAYAHLQQGSIEVSTGDQVCEGDVLAAVGTTGNAGGPHLHFQMMDSPWLEKAKGVPCGFKDYEAWSGGQWDTVEDGIPRLNELIRYGTTSE